MVDFVNLGEIYGRLDNARANDVNIAGARQQQQINNYKLSQAQRADEEAMAIRDIYRSTGGDLNLTQKKLSELGYFDQANAIGKQITESKTAQAGLEKGQLENAEKRLNLVGQGMGFVLQNPTKQNAVRVLENLKNMGALNEEQYQAYVGNMPDDPALVKQGAETLIRMALDAKSQLPQFKNQDAGGQIINQNVNPVTGEVQEVGRIDKTQTPDSIASNERMMREGAANRAVQMRGQNLTNQRGLESNRIAEIKAKNTNQGLTKGQEQVDKEFAKEYASYKASGGFADSQKLISQLEVAANSLKNDSSLTGAVVGRLPDAVREITNPKAIDTRERVEEVVQRNLREVLGAQFTQKEGDRLIARAYNPKLSTEVNEGRVNALIQQMKTAAKTKKEAIEYFEQNGTLQGWDGKMPSINDFESAIEGASTRKGSKTMQDADAILGL